VNATMVGVYSLSIFLGSVTKAGAVGFESGVPRGCRSAES